jgi:hypothetical protein
VVSATSAATKKKKTGKTFAIEFTFSAFAVSDTKLTLASRSRIYQTGFSILLSACCFICSVSPKAAAALPSGEESAAFTASCFNSSSLAVSRSFAMPLKAFSVLSRSFSYGA